MKVQGKTIIVTGAANGIGKEIALELLRRGSNVIAFDRDEKALKELSIAVDNGNLSIYSVDITNKDMINEYAEKIIKERTEVDGLINCAGIIQPFIRFEDTQYEMIKKIMDVNFWGTINVIQAFIKHLGMRAEAHIVNISSMGGFFPVPGQTIYGASKAAVRMLTEGMFAEYQKSNIRVTVVIPGGVNTNIIEHSGSKPNEKMEKIRKVIKLPSPQKAALKIINGMEKNKFRVFIGIDSKLLNFANKLVPRFAIRLATKVTASILFAKN
jgi:short-subunit dehydrogenase